MTSIFKNYRALVTLTKNLEKLGVSNEVVTKAIIQSIGEMDSMMGEYLKKTQKEVDKEVKTTPGGDEVEPKDDQSLMEESDSDDEAEEIATPITCSHCGKKDENYPHVGAVSDKRLGCPLLIKHQRGECKWLIHDLYLLQDKWLIVANTSFGPFIVGEKSYGSRKCNFEIFIGNEFEHSYKFWKWGNGEEEDEVVPYAGIFSLTSIQGKKMEVEANRTYKYLKMKGF